MSTAAKRRLMRDFKRLQDDPPQGVVAKPLDEDIMHWDALIYGPDNSPWEGGTFKLTLKFGDEYPHKPPAVRFLTKLFHPNVYASGQICLDILQNQWSAIYDVAAILTSIQSLLADPNPNSPANVEAAKLFQENRAEYDRKVIEVVEEGWNDNALPLEEASKEASDAVSQPDSSSHGSPAEPQPEQAGPSGVPASTEPLAPVPAANAEPAAQE